MIAKPSSSSQREEALVAWLGQFAPFGVVTLDETFSVQSWNHWMEQHSALRFRDVVGKNLFEVFPDLKERKLTSHFERALLGESSVLSTALHRYLLPLQSSFREPGRMHMLQTARISPLHCGSNVCGIVIVIEDVTQRESQAEALSRQHRRDGLLSWTLAELLRTDEPHKSVRQLFFKIVEQLDFDSFLIYLRDVDSDLLSLNAFGGIPVGSEKDFVNCPFLSLIPAGGLEAARLDGVQLHREPQYAVLQNAGISAAVVLPLVAKEKNIGFLCFATASRDAIQDDEIELVITIARYLATALDRENTHQQLRKVKNDLSDLAQRLEQNVRERTSRLQETVSELEVFSYTIAHDLRAPVRAMTGYCEVLLEDFTNDLPLEAKSIVERILRASGQMELLTRDLLEFGRISHEEVEFSRVDIEPIIEHLVSLRRPDLRDAITVVTPLYPVRGHKGLISHVLANLIDNAIKFVQGEPHITISAELIPPGQGNASHDRAPLESENSVDPPHSQYGNRGQVRVWVKDRGIGIPREAQKKIFGIFERGVGSDLYQGTGIGLAIVARAVQRMGGACGVESEAGQGSRFWIELPAA